MAGIGETAGEQRPLGLGPGQPRQHPVVAQHRAEGLVARCQPLGAGNDVGVDAEHLLAGEEVAEAPESGHHLVGNRQHIVALADLQAGGVVARRRHDDTARGQDRLGDEGGDIAGAELEDLLLQIPHLGGAKRLDAHALGTPVGVRRRQVVDEVVLERHEILVPRLARAGGGQIGAAVVGVMARDDVLLLRPAEHVVQEHREAQRRIDRGRAAGGEKDMPETVRRDAGQLVGQFHRRRVGHAPGAVIAQAAGLFGDRVGDLAPAVADIDAPHPGRPVDQPVAVGIGDVDAVAAGNDGALLPAQPGDLLPGVNPPVVLGLQVLGVELDVRNHAGLSG